jgi:hypothetical protein
MPLHHASEPPASRLVRRCAPLLLFVGMLVGALVPGLIAGDRPFQISLCDDLEQAPAPCGPLERTLLAALRADGADLVQPHEANAGSPWIGARTYSWEAEEQLPTARPGGIAE